MNKKIVNSYEAAEVITGLGEEFALVKNPYYIYSPYEIYPLAKKITDPVDKLHAVVMDMDGTTTTTEQICIHSLEYMIRKMSGKMSKNEWTGLDSQLDYPNIIGNSTTRHVEFLISKYTGIISSREVLKSFIHAAIWTLCFGKDTRRIDEVKNNLRMLNLEIDAERLKPCKSNSSFVQISEEITRFNEKNYSELQHTLLVRLGIDIYYQRYHELLDRIKLGESELIATEIFSDKGKNLIEPMPGVGIFLSIIKGWLDDETGNLLDSLYPEFKKDLTIKKNIKRIAKVFSVNPAKTAIVTSSIFYEADIVMTEVFNLLQKQISEWDISRERKDFLKTKFSDYRNIYDTFVTASDSSEIRLKPHRDLYSIALHQLNIAKENFSKVMGIEDSESGTIAIRAAGIGICVAVPFAETSGHNLSAASCVLHAGLPELLLDKNVFINLSSEGYF